VTTIIAGVEQGPGFTSVALDDPPLAFPYAADALSLYHPDWEVSEVSGGKEAAMHLAPCIYMGFEYEKGRTTRMIREVIE
jgi:hypothetical protein